MTDTHGPGRNAKSRLLRALRCPACRHDHPITPTNSVAAFSCDGCGAALRAPPQFFDANPEHRGRASRVRLAKPARAFIWVLSFSAGLAISATLARTAGLLTANSMAELAIGTGLSRYTRLLVFAPFWALIVALLVTLLNLVVAASWWRIAPRRFIDAAEQDPGPTTASGRGLDRAPSPAWYSANAGVHVP